MNPSSRRPFAQLGRSVADSRALRQRTAPRICCLAAALHDLARPSGTKPTLFATNMFQRRLHLGLRPTSPPLQKSKASEDAGRVTLQGAAGEITTVARKGPRVSILSMDKLESVNPNPIIFVQKESTSPSLESAESSHEHASPRKKATRKRSDPADTKVVTVKLGAHVKSKTPRLSPLRKQILDLEAAYPDCVLLIRVGEFYEVLVFICFYFHLSRLNTMPGSQGCS